MDLGRSEGITGMPCKKKNHRPSRDKGRSLILERKAVSQVEKKHRERRDEERDVGRKRHGVGGKENYWKRGG